MKIDHIHHIFNSVSEFIPFRSQLPLRFISYYFTQSKHSLLDKAEEPEREGIFTFEIKLGKEYLKENLSINFHEDKHCEESIEDSTHIAQSINDSQVASGVDKLLLRVGEGKSDGNFTS